MPDQTPLTWVKAGIQPDLNAFIEQYQEQHDVNKPTATRMLIREGAIRNGWDE